MKQFAKTSADAVIAIIGVVGCFVLGAFDRITFGQLLMLVRMRSLSSLSAQISLLFFGVSDASA